MLTRRLPLIICLALAASAFGADLAQLTAVSIRSSLDQLEKDGDFPAARKELSRQFDLAIAFATSQQLQSIRESAFALRLVTQIEQLPLDRRVPLLKFLRANDELARTLAFLVREPNRPADVYALLDRLRENHPQHVAKFPALTAAICVIHDRPFVREFQGNKLPAPDPADILDYFASNDSRLAYSTRTLPAEMLIHVVDTSASVDEMKWALDRYAKTRSVGRLFFDIHYDEEHWEKGTPKKLAGKAYTLPNLLKYGGICGDQGYFAAAVGKSIGVPSAMVRGASAETGHYWCGFYQGAGDNGKWNFRIGRYDAYRNISGNIIDPQSRQEIPDTFVGLLAELARITPSDRQTAVALTDAARRLIDMFKSGGQLPDAPPPGIDFVGQPRRRDVASQLQLVEMAARLCPGERYCWQPLEQLAAAGQLSVEMKQYWSAALETICAKRYPDFFLHMLVPMIRTIDNLPEQQRVWEWAHGIVNSRPDLAAQVRMEQAAMWEHAQRLELARACCLEVIEKYVNSGPFVIDALKKAETAMRETDQKDKILPLFERTWARAQRPREMAGPFVTQSNWYQIGQLLVDRLESAGQKERAETVRTQLAGRVPPEQ